MQARENEPATHERSHQNLIRRGNAATAAIHVGETSNAEENYLWSVYEGPSVVNWTY